MYNFFLNFKNAPRRYKQILMLLVDIAMLLFALWLSFSLRLGQFYLPDREVILLFLIGPVIAIPVFIKSGLYRAIIRYIGFKALWTIIKAVSLYAIIWSAIVFLSGINGVPRSVTLINWLITILLIGGSRMIARWWFTGIEINNPLENNIKKNVAIYGAGSAGMQLASVLEYSKEYKPVLFIDDKQDLHNTNINQLSVFAPSELEKLIDTFSLDYVFLALPSASHSARKTIIQSLERYPVHVRTLPAMAEVADGKIRLEDIKEVELEDLLGRDPVEPDEKLFDQCIKGKSVLVTGAGGSIGAELCRQVISRQPASLVLYEVSEVHLYKIEQELGRLIAQEEIDIRLIPVLGNVIDADRVSRVVKTYNINTIYHAAAYKHVPMVEYNVTEGVKINALGTYTVANAAKTHNVDNFILISTDKAVRPTNVMGASKRFAELVLQGLAKEACNTTFSMVRFGNVLGSSGSVVPLFREQIKNGGPVTVTHPDIIRYFMTIPEAVQLVIQAGAMGAQGAGGDVFVLDMGEPVKITELAQKMIRLMGFSVKDSENPDGDIEIHFSGLRPGEKLYEELLIGDNAIGTSHPRILRAEEEAYSYQEIIAFVEKLKDILVQEDSQQLIALLVEVVNGFQPSAEIQDVLWRGSKTKASVINLKEKQ